MAIIDQFHAQGTRILVEEIKQEDTKTAGGIWLVDGGSVDFKKARIVSTGNSSSLPKGAVVLYLAKAGVHQMIGAKNYVWLDTPEVWAVIEDSIVDEVGNKGVAPSIAPQEPPASPIIAN